MQVFTDEHRQLVSVLNDRRDSCAATPVVVQMRVLVREDLHLIRSQSTLVVDDVVAGGRHSSLADGLADQEEVVAVDGQIKLAEAKKTKKRELTVRAT